MGEEQDALILLSLRTCEPNGELFCLSLKLRCVLESLAGSPRKEARKELRANFKLRPDPFRIVLKSPVERFGAEAEVQ